MIFKGISLKMEGEGSDSNDRESMAAVLCVGKGIETDSEYMVLKQQLYDQLPDFQKVLQMLSPEYQSVILEHMGICAEMAQRETEIVCFMD